jgi:hypothetical protein
MANNNEAAGYDDSLSIEDAIRELWDKAARNMTTSQEIEAISPEMAAKYRQNRENAAAIQKIRAEVDRLKRDTSALKGWMKRIGGLFTKAGE